MIIVLSVSTDEAGKVKVLMLQQGRLPNQTIW
jgi:hypothetical protein